MVSLVTSLCYRDESSYNLFLSPDLYTTKHTQWFYFQVQNTRKGQTYTFHISNLLKVDSHAYLCLSLYLSFVVIVPLFVHISIFPFLTYVCQPDSLYNHGMQPCVFSRKQHDARGRGWHRDGHGICYYKNDTRVMEMRGERYYYTLTFSWTAEYDHDTVLFAHCFPYTYTDLQNYITSLLGDADRAPFCRSRVLCHTLAGNVCDLLTVTNFGGSQAEMAARKVVLVFVVCTCCYMCTCRVLLSPHVCILERPTPHG